MWNEIFIVQGQPCDQARIEEIQARIGFALPSKYQEVIRAYGGGVLNPDIDRLRDDHELGCRLYMLFGNGTPEGALTGYDLDGYAMDLMELWEMPQWGFLVGLDEGEIHTPILLNLSNPNYPMGALVCVDHECDEEVLIAHSFDELWQKIEANIAGNPSC
ncbi:MAG: SMI1/KNR4 family protein [Corynebacterium sp.]|uniref:SMI1/KNR4 family protein n=1 Tax=Corynebacterium sp. TaxID=1720 RepID=UPI0026DA9C92|nr:SMI1/KNR4 family protein [Corynebacterium sp.]MDO4760494.1 SMI1/KNR4 family protein [Corynebacterium sp.]